MEDKSNVIEFRSREKRSVSQSSSSAGNAIQLCLLFCSGCLRYWSAPFKWSVGNSLQQIQEAPLCIVCKNNEHVELLKIWEPKWPRR